MTEHGGTRSDEEAVLVARYLPWPETWYWKGRIPDTVPAPVRTRERLRGISILLGMFVVALLVSVAVRDPGPPAAALDPDVILRVVGEKVTGWGWAVAPFLLVASQLVGPDPAPPRETVAEVAVPGGGTEWALVFERPYGARMFACVWAAAILVIADLNPTQDEWPMWAVLGAFAVVFCGIPLGAWLFPLLCPARRTRVMLTESAFVHVSWSERARVPWDHVTAVRAYSRPAGRGVTSYQLGLAVHAPGAPFRARRRDPGDPQAFSEGVDVAVDTDSVTLWPPRLYWACVAFRDPERREALLDGAEIAAPAEPEPLPPR